MSNCLIHESEDGLVCKHCGEPKLMSNPSVTRAECLSIAANFGGGHSHLTQRLARAHLALLDDAARARRIIYLYFMPWGAAKAAMWGEIAGNGHFNSERAMELVRDALPDPPEGK